jgi:hypothetical protein
VEHPDVQLQLRSGVSAKRYLFGSRVACPNLGSGIAHQSRTMPGALSDLPGAACGITPASPTAGLGSTDVLRIGSKNSV